MKNCLFWEDKTIATKKIAGWLLENVTEEVDDKAGARWWIIERREIIELR
jgi:hypothetical protein